MKKNCLKIIIIGHTDHGKSTLIGRLLLETNSLPKEKLSELKKASKKSGKPFKLAFLSDQLKEERTKNITMDTTQVFFKTPKRNYTIIDVPGHLKFIKNMITGVTQAQAAILIIDVNQGLMEQTRRHANIIKILGINELIIVFNKIDLIKYKKERFNQVKKELTDFLDQIQIKTCFYIPLSAEKGFNVAKRSSRIKWYKGPTLIEALDQAYIKSKRRKSNLRFPVQDIYKIKRSNIIVGKIASGTIKKDQPIIVMPGEKKTTVKAIKLFGEHNRKKASLGQSIGITLDKALPIKRGQVICDQSNPPPTTDRFEVKVFWMAKTPLKTGRNLIFRCATQKIDCIVEKIEKRIDSVKLNTIKQNAKQLKQNELGIVRIKTKKSVIIENFSRIEELGRFVLEHKTQIYAGGIITNKLDP
jgi:sulfate adenylyltransferase large subunit